MRNCIHHIWSSLPEARHFKLRQKKHSTPSNAVFYKILLILHIWYDFSKSLKPPKNLYLSYFRKFQKVYTIEFIVFTENLVFYMCLSVRCSVPVCNCIGLRVNQRGNDRNETLYIKFHQFLFCK